MPACCSFQIGAERAVLQCKCKWEFSAARRRYGDLKARNVRGVVLETFGVGNMPDLPRLGWLPWLKKTVKQGIKASIFSQLA